MFDKCEWPLLYIIYTGVVQCVAVSLLFAAVIYFLRNWNDGFKHVNVSVYYEHLGNKQNVYNYGEVEHIHGTLHMRPHDE